MTTSVRPRIISEFIDDSFTAARAAGVPSWDNDQFSYIAHVFEDIFTTSPCGFRTTTHPAALRDLDVRYFDPYQPVDPYDRALKAGILKREGHPIEDLTLETQAQIPLVGYGSDVGVRNGFKKIWPYFAYSVPVDDLYNLPALPEGVKLYDDYFRKYDLTRVCLIALDYFNKTMNTYVLLPDPNLRTPEKIAGMIEDLGFEVPSQEILELNSTSVITYHTFNWETPEIERVCFVLVTPAEKLLQHPNPLLRKYAAEAPSFTSKRGFTSNTTYGRRGDYLKVEIDYTGTMENSISYAFVHYDP